MVVLVVLIPPPLMLIKLLQVDVEEEVRVKLVHLVEKVLKPLQMHLDLVPITVVMVVLVLTGLVMTV